MKVEIVPENKYLPSVLIKYPVPGPSSSVPKAGQWGVHGPRGTPWGHPGSSLGPPITINGL